MPHKRILGALALILCLCMASTAVMVSDDDQHVTGTPVLASSVDDFTFKELYTTTGSGSSAVTTHVGYSVSAKISGLTGDVVIPDTYNNLPVTKINANGFRDCYNITSVLIPHTIKSVGTNAFTNCSSLKTIYYNSNYATTTEAPYTKATSPWCDAGSDEGITVIYGNAVTSISAYGMFGANNLKHASLSASVKTIGEAAFANSSLETIRMESVATLGDNAFYGCISLKEIVLPDTVETIGVSAFENCESLTSLNIPTSVSTINTLAFSGCINISTITYSCNSNAVTYTSTDTAWKNVGSNTDGVAVIMTDDVTALPNYAFSYFTNLKNIIISENLVSIGQNAFQYTNLEAIKIPSKVTYIGQNAFQYCRELASIYYDAASGDSTISGNDIGKNVDSGITLTIGKNVNSIAAGKFSSLKYVTTVYYNAPAVANLSLGSSSIAPFQSTGSNGSYKLIIGDNVTSIPSGVFYKSVYLNHLVIGESVFNIGSNAFNYCNKLAVIEYNAVSASTATYSVSSSPWGTSAEDSQVGKSLSKGVTLIISENVKGLPNLIFINLVHLEHVEFNATNLTERVYTSTTTPWYGAGTSKAPTLTVGDNVTQIPTYAFAYFSSLKSASIGASVSAIHSQAFAQCTSLTSISMPETTKYTASSIPSSVEVTYADVYTVAYNTNGGTLISSYATLEGRTVLTPEDPTKEGYTFAGWYSDADLKTTYNFSSPVTSDITLYASWTAVIPDDPDTPNPPAGDTPSDTPLKKVPYWVYLIAVILILIAAVAAWRLLE